MNKRRRAYKKFDWRSHFKKTAPLKFWDDVLKGEVTPSSTGGRLYVFKKTVRLGKEKFTMTVTAVDKAVLSELENRILYG